MSVLGILHREANQESRICEARTTPLRQTGQANVVKLNNTCGYFIFQNGWTPLIYAAYYGQLEPVKLLLKNKVMVNMDNKVKRESIISRY